MYASPITAVFEIYRNQAALFSKMVTTLVETSMQVSNLNITATRKLMEESTTAMQRAMTLKTPQETQAFLMEQSQLAVERVRGYQQNVQGIAKPAMQLTAGTQTEKAEVAPAQQAAQPAAQSVEAHVETDDKHTSAKQQHEVDPHPSALVEKLISVAVHDTENHQGK